MLPIVGGTQESGPAAAVATGLAPGDQLSVHMYDFPDLAAPVTVHIAPDGTVHLPYVGTVTAGGLSPAEVEQNITSALQARGIVKDPNVTVDVVSAVNLTVNVIGQVARPAAIPLFAPTPLGFVLSQVGGVTGIASRHLTIIHPGAVEPTSVNYDSQAPTAVALHTLVRPGDVINVANGEIYYICGEINRPGIYPITGALSAGSVNGSFGIGVSHNLTLLGALTQAGGITSIAARSQMRILRMENGKRVEIKVDQVKLYKGEIADPLIHPDDIIYIPSSYIRQQTNNLFGTAVSSIYAATQVRTLQ